MVTEEVSGAKALGPYPQRRGEPQIVANVRMALRGRDRISALAVKVRCHFWEQ